MGLENSLSIATSGLTTINTAIAVLSQNIANVSTPGYSLEVAVQVSATAGGLQSGVVSKPTIREINAQFEAQSEQQSSVVSGLQTSQQALQQIDAVQGTPGAGTDLSSLVGALQDAFSKLQNDPSNQTQQQAVVTAAQNLTQQINRLSNAYQSGRQAAQDGVVANVATLNDTLATIGSLSNQIVQFRQEGVSTADLENQRDAAEATVSTLVPANFVEQPDGDVQVYTSSGLALPTQFTTPPIAISSATLGASAAYPSGGIPPIILNGQDVTNQFTGGQIGAQIALRDKTLPTDQAELDEFSQTLSTRFSAQGLSLFTQPDGSVPTSGGTPVQNGYVGYAGTITVNPAIVQSPSLVRDGTQDVAGSATGASAFTTNPSGGPAGFTDLISRVLNFTFGVQAQSGVAQPSPEVSGLGSAGNLSAPYAPSADLASFATDLVSAQSQVSATTTQNLTTAQALQTTLQTNLSKTSGVDVDTEMSNLVALQNAYGANAKIIGTLQTLFTDVLNILTT
jgi:flagellar hook-associated protein 1 FlgK